MSSSISFPWQRKSKWKYRFGVVLFFTLAVAVSFGLGWGWGNIAGWMDGYHTATKSVAREIANGVKYGNHFWLGEKVEFRSLRNGSSGYVYVHELPKKEVAKDGNN